ncbi:alpha/beta-hydrolase [Mycena epipterygia]|nr:alpha/beta-hydrolase [Mycena epipterygia]
MRAPSTTKILRSTDGTTLFAEATGDPRNPHVVLIAGLSLSGCVFDDMCADPRLLDTLYIVRYDTRGHGRSGKPSTTEALEKPILVGWSMGGAVATDVATHLPPATLSGVVYLAGVPDTIITREMAAPALIAVIPGLVSNDSVAVHQASVSVFIDALFADPAAVPYAVRCLHAGHSLSPEIMGLCLTRSMDVESLWAAGRAGLPMLVVQGTLDAHRVGGAKGVDEIMRPHFKNYEIIWLEGRGHALHYECPDEIVDILIKFTKKVGGKDYRT